MNRFANFSDPTAATKAPSLAGAPPRLRVFTDYWRLNDSVCGEFLKLGTAPADFEAVKFAFPYLRELCVSQAPRRWQFVGDALFFAFCAGHDLGCRQPGLSAQVLPAKARQEAGRRLTVLLQTGSAESLTYGGLARALQEVARDARPAEAGPDANSVVCTLVLKSFRCGFAAATVAKQDTVLAPIVAKLGQPVADNFPLFERALIASPWRALEEGVGGVFAHPLLRLARELYPEKSVEGKTILEFLARRLKSLGITREDVCPTGELALLDWVTAGMEYGKQVRQAHPDMVAAIFRECAGERLEVSYSIIRRTVEQAGSLKPLQLIRPLLEWYRQAHSDKEPEFYGQRLARVGCLTDFAVWIPWIFKRSPRRRK